MGCNYSLSLILDSQSRCILGKKHVCFGIKSGIGLWRTAVPLVVKCHNFDVERVDADDESL